MIPCHERQPWESIPTPAFAHCDHAELWTLLIEKAFAKLAGSYADLKGGRPECALQALTGCEQMWCFNKDEDDGLWHKLDIESGAGKPRDFKNVAGEPSKGQKPLIDSDMQKLVERFDQQNFLMVTMIDSTTGESKRLDGLVAGHAYSLMTCKSVSGQAFVKLRNPWGNEIEWNGKWADSDVQSWLGAPDICLALQGKEFQDSLN